MKKASEIWDTPEATGFNRAETGFSVEEFNDGAKRAAAKLHLDMPLPNKTDHEIIEELLRGLTITDNPDVTLLTPNFKEHINHDSFYEVIITEDGNVGLDCRNKAAGWLRTTLKAVRYKEREKCMQEIEDARTEHNDARHGTSTDDAYDRACDAINPKLHEHYETLHL